MTGFGEKRTSSGYEGASSFRLPVRSAARLRAILKQIAALDGLRLSATWPRNSEIMWTMEP